jgi:hypothetical protein
MDRILCLILCAIVIVVSVLALNYCNASVEPPITQTEPTVTVTEPPTTETTVPPATEPIVETTVATEPPTVETEPVNVLYDVPLSEDLQRYIISLCEGKNIDPAIVFAMIWRESRFNHLSVGDNGNSLGLMQIQPRWHSGLMAEFGCDDLLDPYQNVTIGIAILAGHVNYYDGNVEMGVMAYNAGKAGAYSAYFSKGVYSSPYSSSVFEKAEELRGTAYADENR